MLPNPLFWNVHMYGIMVAVGILGTFIVLYLYSKIKKVDVKFTDFAFYNGIASIVVGFGSASLFQSVYNYIENPEAGFRFTGSITFIGGLIGGVLCFITVYLIFRRKFTTKLYQVVSIYPCCIIIAHAFGRIGCFFAGCCYGKPTDSFLGVKFPRIPYEVHPTQLYEAAFLFILFSVCSYLVLKKDFKHNLSLYLIMYGIFRFFIEFLRDDDRGELIGVISPSQFWSILMVVAGIILVFFMRHLLKNDNKKEGA